MAAIADSAWAAASSAWAALSPIGSRPIGARIVWASRSRSHSDFCRPPATRPSMPALTRRSSSASTTPSDSLTRADPEVEVVDRVEAGRAGEAVPELVRAGGAGGHRDDVHPLGRQVGAPAGGDVGRLHGPPAPLAVDRLLLRRRPGLQRPGEAELELLLPRGGDRLAEVARGDDHVHLEPVQSGERRAHLLCGGVGEELVAHDRGGALPLAHLRGHPVPGVAGGSGEVVQAGVAPHRHRGMDQLQAWADDQHPGLRQCGGVVLQHLLDEGGARLRATHVEVHDLRHRSVRPSWAEWSGAG